MRELTSEQIERYSRHILLSKVGGSGQARLLESRVLVIGAGGLGSPAALYLAAAGVGTLGLIDGDMVELSNLQRQILHSTPDVGKPKVESAAEKLRRLNPDVKIKTCLGRVTAQNIAALIREYDFIIEGTDNFPSKFLVNDACVLEQKPFSHGGILQFGGQTLTWAPGSACYRCLFPSPPPQGAVPSCSQAGVFGAIAGMLGTIQAAEALRYLLGIGRLLTDRMLIFDALEMEFQTVDIRPDPECPVCGEHPTITEPQDVEQPACELRAAIRQKV